MGRLEISVIFIAGKVEKVCARLKSPTSADVNFLPITIVYKFVYITCNNPPISNFDPNEKRILNEEKEKLQEGCQRTKKNKNTVLKVAFMKDWTANAHTP